MAQTFADHLLHFYQQLHLDITLPEGVEVMNPYQDASAFALCQQFYHQYYGDTQSRTMILGINPGRFGGGITGIPFTDPIKLEQICHIPNNLPRKAELSADYIYRLIDAYGGPETFYSQFYFSAMSPLGFVKDDKNLNYYDIKSLATALTPFMVRCIQEQLAFGANPHLAFCLGEGDNFRYLQKLNDAHGFFQRIVPLAHPRFIMQYKRKSLDLYIQDYIGKLRSA